MTYLKNVLFVILMAILIGCGGNNVSPKTLGGTIHPVASPLGESAGRAQLAPQGANRTVQGLSFTIHGTQGKSPLHYSGKARFVGQITFGTLSDLSIQGAYHTTANYYNSCPTSGLPISFQCDAVISYRNFSGCAIQFAAGAVGALSTGGLPTALSTGGLPTALSTGGLPTGSYVMSGSFFSAKDSKSKSFGILNVCVEGRCTGPSCTNS